MAMISPKELATKCGVAIGTVYWWVATGQVPHARLGPRLVRFCEDEIDAWLAAKRVSARAGATANPPDSAAPSSKGAA